MSVLIIALYGSIGLEQPAQIAFDALLIAAPDDFRHLELGLGSESVMRQHPRENHRTDHHQIALGNGNRAHLVVPRALRKSGNQ